MVFIARSIPLVQLVPNGENAPVIGNIIPIFISRFSTGAGQKKYAPTAATTTMNASIAIIDIVLIAFIDRKQAAIFIILSKFLQVAVN